MSDSKNNNEAVKPRFEFRSFAQDFSTAAGRMARLSLPVPEKLWQRSSDEIYIMSRTNNINNTKIRDAKMDIKTLVQTVDGLEQWNPLMKAEFPISRKLLQDSVFPAFQVDLPKLDQEQYSYNEFMSMIDAHADLQAVKVHKERFAYNVNNTICEVGNICFNGASVVTINSESTELADIKQTLLDVGLDNTENINYLQAIKRVIGMINKDLAN